MQLRIYQEQLNEWTDKEIALAERKLRKLYHTSLEEVYSELNRLFMKYEEEGLLTYSEMVRYNRLEKFLLDINSEFENLRKAKEALVIGLFLLAFQRSYKWISWSIAREKLIDVKPKKTLDKMEKEILGKPFTGLTILQRLKRNHSNLLYDIREVITRLLVKGSTYKEIGSGLKGVLEKDLNRTAVITRTETHRARMEAAYIRAEEIHDSGIQQTKEWISMRDERVRNTKQASHVKMDGVKVPMDDYFDLGGGKHTLAPLMSGYPEHDINCRCTIAFDSVPTEEQQNKDLKDIGYERYIEITFSGDGFD